MIELTKDEQEYVNNERMMFDMDTKYVFNPKKCIVEYRNNYLPTKHLIDLLRKKYGFPKGKYNVIYMDMPWEYNNKKTGGNHKSGATQKYNTIPTGTLRFELSILINNIAAKNAVVFFWMTVPMEREQTTVFDALDFKLKSKIFWNKTGDIIESEPKTVCYKEGRLGMGFWVRHQVEFMMIGIKGDVKAFRSAKRNLVNLPILAHSEKPGEFREYIKSITSSMGKVRKIELFARSTAKTWISWGDQLGL